MGWVVNARHQSLYPRERPGTRYGRLGGPQGRSGRVPKNLPPPGFCPLTVQPVASRYTDCSIPTPYIYMYIHTHTHIHTYIHTYIYTFICMCARVYIYIYIYMYRVYLEESSIMLEVFASI